MTRVEVHKAIDAERDRQDRLKAEGKFDFTCADPELGNPVALVILAEEVGEVARAVLNLEDYAHDKWSKNLKEELIQVAAVATAWLEVLA